MAPQTGGGECLAALKRKHRGDIRRLYQYRYYGNQLRGEYGDIWGGALNDAIAVIIATFEEVGAELVGKRKREIYQLGYDEGFGNGFEGAIWELVRCLDEEGAQRIMVVCLRHILPELDLSGEDEQELLLRLIELAYDAMESAKQWQIDHFPEQ